MDNDEALRLLEREVDAFRGESYDDLVRRMDADTLAYELAGSSGAQYQVEITFHWDGPKGGDIRVIGSIDDGGWRAFLPLTRSFIKSADGSFVGE